MKTISRHWNMPTTSRRRAIRFFFLCIVLAILNVFMRAEAQQYVRTLRPQNGGNLVLNTISRSLRTPTTYYVAGIQDSSIYVAEINAAGTVLQEKLIGTSSRANSITSMITDDDGNIVIMGRNFRSVAPTLASGAFAMKVSQALSLLFFQNYNNSNQAAYATLAFNDVKDNKAAGQYYVCGGHRTGNIASDAVLAKLDRNTGAIVALTAHNAGEDNYSSLVFDSSNVSVGSGVFVTGRLSNVSNGAMRPWINQHNSVFAFAQGARYLTPDNISGRLYSHSMVKDNNRLAFTWQGDLASTGILINTGLAVSDAVNLGAVWQREYSFSPAVQTRKNCLKIANDANGYATMGYWWNGTTTGVDGGHLGEMFLLRTDKSGNPLWSRRIKDVMVYQTSGNAGMLTDGASIFAAGYKTNTVTGKTEGVVVCIPLLNGAMDTSCAPLQNVKVVRSLQFAAKDSVTTTNPAMVSTMRYFPVNCIGTDTMINCNQPCTDSIKLNADFSLFGGLIAGNTTNFTVFANSFSTGPNSQWIVSRTASITGNPDVTGTIYNSVVGGIWATASSTGFGGYNGTGTIAAGGETTASSPAFLTVNRYRVRHILSYTNRCGIVKTDTVVKTVAMCAGCRQATDGLVVTNETPSAYNVATPKMETYASTSQLTIVPNPAKGKSVSLLYEGYNGQPVTITISDAQGKSISTQTFSNGVKQTGRFTINTSMLTSGVYNVTLRTDKQQTATQKLVVVQ